MPTVTYTAWKQSVATIIQANAGLSPDDIPTISFPQLFDAGCTPQEAADDAIANADTVAAYGFITDPDDPDDLPF